ncbi:MAG: chemotaxis protein CheX [Epsilonproteobacteria bacterium]|nr:chemotaxis protein CheX [Campylobacterota bacterium]
MLPTILQAAENFCIHQIRLPHTTAKMSDKKRTLIAYLDIETNSGIKHRAYLGCDSVLIQHIAEIFLGEENSDEETLMDMLLETTNMIIGSAKVLAEASDANSFTISTPHFIKEDYFTMPYDAMHTVQIANGEMLLAIKAL